MTMDRINTPRPARRRLLWIAAVWLCLWPVAAQASHYYLTDLNRFETAQVVLFRDQGLQTTGQVLEATLTDRARKALAPLVGLSQEQLLELAHDCELMQISGIGPKAVRLLRAAQINSVEALAGSQPAALLEQLQGLNKDFTYTSKHPTLDLVQYWIEQAQKAPLRVK